MANLIIPIPAKADLEKGIKKTYLDMIFATQDEQAHRVDVQLMRGKEQVNLSGAGISAYFIRYSDNVTIPLKGEASGNIASVTLKQSCYHKSGQFALIVKATVSGVTNTVFYGEGSIFVSLTDTVLNDENVIPSLDDLLAQIAAMEAGTDRANAAADRCERMQMDASGMAGDSNKLGGKAPEYYVQPRNLLDNSDFRNPVNQRGKTNYAEGGHGIDRWRSTSNAPLSVLESGINLDASALGSSNVITQYIVGVRDGTYTLACCTNDGGNKKISTRVVTFGDKSVTTVENNNASYPGGYIAAIYASGYYAMQMRANAGSNVTIEWAALYEGAYTAETLPPYVPKGYLPELLECQRYYVPLYKYARYRAVRAAADSIIFTIPLPVEMYRTPSFKDGSGIAKVSDLSGSSQSGFTITVSTACGNSVQLTASKSAHGLSDAFIVFATNDAESAASLGCEP